MIGRIFAWLVGCPAMLLLAGAARADLAPPPDYVETCTVERIGRPGLECRSCSAWHGEVDACSKSLGKEGFTHNCRTSGASVWNEVWCRPAAAAAPTSVPAPGPTPADPSVVASPATGTPTSPPTTTPTSEQGAGSGPTPGSADATTPNAGPPGPPPGARGCGSCSVGSGETSSLLAGPGLTVLAVAGGVGLRATGRRRRHRP